MARTDFTTQIEHLIATARDAGLSDEAIAEVLRDAAEALRDREALLAAHATLSGLGEKK